MVAINLLPWRQKYYKRIKRRERYGIIFIMAILFFLIGVRHRFTAELEDLRGRNHLRGNRFSVTEAAEKKRNKTIELISFLSKLPLAVQDDLYIGKIVMRENRIKLDVYAGDLSHLERFVEKIKKQGGIAGIVIDSSATHGGLGSVNKENKFILTLSLDHK